MVCISINWFLRCILWENVLFHEISIFMRDKHHRWINSTFLSKSPFFVRDQYITFRGIERKCCSAFLPRLEQRSEDEPTRGYLTEIMDKYIWTLEYVVSIYLKSAHYRNTWPEAALLHKLESFLLFPFSNYSLCQH